MQQQQQPNVPPLVRLHVASMRRCCAYLGASAYATFTRAFLHYPTRPDPTRPKFLLPTTRYYFSLLITPHLLLLLLSTHLILFYHSYFLCIYYLLSLFVYCCYFSPTCFDWLRQLISLFFQNDFSCFFVTKLFHEPFFFFYHSYFLCICYLLFYWVRNSNPFTHLFLPLFHFTHNFYLFIVLLSASYYFLEISTFSTNNFFKVIFF
jgi:hypothetical protein